MERLQPGEDVCVLVAEDGNYRLEKLLRSKAELYVGSLDAAQVEALHAMLASDPLATISQADIHAPLVTDTLDNVRLATLGSGGWRQIVFPSPDSRKPFRASIDPLLRWFQGVQKEHPKASRLEGTPSRCVPPATTQLSASEASPASQQVLPTASDGGYLFRLYSRHFYRGDVESNCTVVFADGSYRREHANQEIGADRRDRIREGQLDEGKVQELKGILASTDLRNSPGNPDVGNPKFSREDALTTLSVPRERAVQSLVFSSTFNTIGSPNEVGGRSNMTYNIADEKILNPLKRWIKLNVDHDHAPDRSEPGDECAPVKVTNSEGPKH